MSCFGPNSNLNSSLLCYNSKVWRALNLRTFRLKCANKSSMSGERDFNFGAVQLYFVECLKILFASYSLPNSGLFCRNTSAGSKLYWRSKGPLFSPGFWKLISCIHKTLTLRRRDANVQAVVVFNKKLLCFAPCSLPNPGLFCRNPSTGRVSSANDLYLKLQLCLEIVPQNVLCFAPRSPTNKIVLPWSSWGDH